MSRIGKQIIEIPQGVTVTLTHDELQVRGPKGTLTRKIHPLVTVRVEGETVTIDVAQHEEKKERSLWGTFGSHIQNMVEGVTKGFKKQLEINGVGYKVALQGKDLRLDVGFSHPVMYHIPETVTVAVEKNVMTLESPDKELLGQTAAEIRGIKKPEPYKGKGIKYSDETIRRKAGKAAKTA